MEWTTLLATFLGAAIATTTSLLAQARKDRRDTAAEWLRVRRDLYAAFLTSLTKARSGLLAVSKNGHEVSRDEHDENARQVFAHCYELRHQLELFAPPSVTEPAVRYFRAVRGLRDHVALGNPPRGEAWDAHMTELKRTLDAVHEAMRRDLEPGPWRLP